MIDLEELRRAAEDENADGIWISPEAAHYLLDRIEKAEADIAAVRELTFMIRPRYLPAYIRNRLDAPDPAQAAEKDATRCPDHPKAAIGYTDPTGGDPFMGGPVSIPVCSACGRQLTRPTTPASGGDA